MSERTISAPIAKTTGQMQWGAICSRMFSKCLHLVNIRGVNSVNIVNIVNMSIFDLLDRYMKFVKANILLVINYKIGSHFNLKFRRSIT